MEEFTWSEKGWKALLRRISHATRRRPGDAEDLLQKAFLRLEDYRARAAVRNPAAFLVRTAINIAHDERRHLRVRDEIDAWEDLVGGIPDSQPLQDEVLIAQERLDQVRAALSRLKPRTRDVFLMHRVEGMTYREIAGRLGLSVSAVEKHIAKAALLLAQNVRGA